MSDLISRDAAIEALLERDANSGLDSAEVIKHLPSAERTGKWFMWDDDDERYSRYMCTCCRKDIIIDSRKHFELVFTIEDMKYCPNCGVKMIREGQE